MGLFSYLWPAVSAGIGYALAYAASTLVFDISIAGQAVWVDFGLVLFVSYLLSFMMRRGWVFSLLQWFLIGFLYVGNAAKLSFFGGPIVPDDVYALRSLILLLGSGQRFLVLGLLACLAGFVVLNFHYRKQAFWLTFTLIAVLAIGMKSYSKPMVAILDKHFGNSVWNQRENYLKRGATLYSLQETARFFRDMEQPPDRKDALSSAAFLLKNQQPRRIHATFRPRNVHYILLESFWDPLALKQIRFNRDPLNPKFRELWRATGHSKIMSPVFGGYTANAEFESLCGFPVVNNDVKFERRLLNNANCLPAVLERQGYDAIASHPNVASFWNRINAYRRIGFKTYWSIKDFDLDDMNFTFLSDPSLYRQVMQKLGRRKHPQKFVFNYIVTYFGHWAGPKNYPLKPSTRPTIIRCESGCNAPEIESYANVMYYKSREFMAFIEELRTVDPDALIVAFGDHLPFLGTNFRGYVEAGTLAGASTNFTPEMFLTYVTTPLIVIDGRRGPIAMGTLPLYQLPGEIVRLLGIDEATIFDYSMANSGVAVRPLWGISLVIDEQGRPLVCRDAKEAPLCGVSAEWLDHLLTVGRDIFQGKQYTNNHLSTTQ